MGDHDFIDAAALERSLATLRERFPADGLIEALRQVIVATRRLFGATGAGIMMVDAELALAAVVATDEPGWLLEVSQERLGRGPCVDALTFDEIVETGDLGADDRWPALLPELPQAGVRAVLGVPIHASGVAVGSLNVYRDRPCEWSQTELTALEAYAGLIEKFLSSALQAREKERLAEQLQYALDNRVVTERAVGVIMAREAIDAVEAFNQLRSLARGAGRRVAEVAGELLAEIPRASAARISST